MAIRKKDLALWVAGAYFAAQSALHKGMTCQKRERER